MSADLRSAGVRVPLPRNVTDLIAALNVRLRELRDAGLHAVVVVAHEYPRTDTPALHQVQAELFALPVSAPAVVFPIRPPAASRAGVA